MTTRLVINLLRSKERLKTITKILQDSHLSFQKIDAVDGNSLNLDDIKICSKFGKQLTASEIGCFLSHKKCWEYILQNNLDGAFIFEDDIQILEPSLLQLSTWVPHNADLIQLSFFPTIQKQSKKFYRSHKVLKINDKHSLVQLLSPIPWGTQAYWISASGAKQALLLSQTITEPVDHFFI